MLFFLLVNVKMSTTVISSNLDCEISRVVCTFFLSNIFVAQVNNRDLQPYILQHRILNTKDNS